MGSQRDPTCCTRCGGELDGRSAVRCSRCLRAHADDTAGRAAKRDAAGLCRACGSDPAPADAGHFCRPHWFRQVARKTAGGVHAAADLKRLWLAQGGRCAVTGVLLTPGDGAALDHIVPRARGGTHEPHNLRWVTVAVNTAKAALTDLEFIALCAAVVRGPLVRAAANDNATP